MLQRFVRVNIACDVWQLARVPRKRGKDKMVVSNSGEGQLAVTSCFTHDVNHSSRGTTVISREYAYMGKCRITVLICLSYIG
jgi:hypothetical protein